MLMVCFALIIVVPSSAPRADEGTQPETRSVIGVLTGTMETIRDVQFVFEGESRIVPEAHRANKLDTEFQGTYAYRTEDGATLLDVYQQRLRGNLPLRRVTAALLRGRLETLEHTPDVERKEAAVGVGGGGPGSMNKPLSPERFLAFSHLRLILKDPAGYGLEAKGWEPVDGLRCLNVQADQTDFLKGPDRPIIRMWLDLERGGFPLKVECWRGNVMYLRTHHIVLDPVPLPGGKVVWFPVSGETDSYSHSHGEAAGGPYFHEVCKVVRSSLRLNQGLRDDVFTARWDGRLPLDETPKPARQHFEDATKRAKAKRPRTDPAGVQERLKASLSVAERQAKQLEASSPARESWSWTSVWQITLIAIGVAILCGGLALRRRGL